MNTNNEELKIYNLQIIASLLFIISIIVSIILTYNEKLELLDKKTIFNTKEKNKINIYNKIFAFVLLCIFLYCSYASYSIEKRKGNDNEGLKLQVIVALFVILTSLGALYIAINYQDEDIDFSNIPL